MGSAEQLPPNLLGYIKFIENAVDVPIKIVSVGPDRKQTVFRYNMDTQKNEMVEA